MSFELELQALWSQQFEHFVSFFISENNELKDGLNRLSDVHKKLSLIESSFEKHNLFAYHDFLPGSNKSNEISTYFRENGNRLYVEKKFLPALVAYNISLAFAKHDSINFILGFSNRSAVLYKMGKYRKCLGAIEQAKKCTLELPSSVSDKLDKRKTECDKNLCREVKDAKELEFKLSYPKHQNCSYIANCLELKKSIGAPNFFYTSRNLKAGDVVSSEPFLCTNAMREDKFGMFCFYCLDVVLDSAVFFSCPSCSNVCYCSIECRQKDWDPCHKYLCHIGVKLSQIPPKLYLALQVSLLGRNIFKNISALNFYCKNKKLFGGNNQDEELQKKEYYKVFYNIVNSGRKTDKNDLNFLVHLALIRRCLLKFTELKFENNEEEKLFINLVIHNYNNSTRFMPFKKNTRLAVVGPISELFYHSCSPNVEQFIQQGRIITIAIKPIKANETLTKSYGHCRFYEKPKLERQEYLKNMYGFTCSCEACRNNYGTVFSYEDNLALPPLEMCHIPLENLRSKGVSSVYESLIKYLEKYGNNKPCRQLVLAGLMLQGVFSHEFFI